MGQPTDGSNAGAAPITVKRIEITYDFATDKLNITGNIHDQMFCLGALEFAKRKLQHLWIAEEMQAAPRIVPPLRRFPG